jgi:hypothetical protein
MVPAGVESGSNRGHAGASRGDSAGSSAGSGGAGAPLVGRGHIRAWLQTLGQVPVPGIIPRGSAGDDQQLPRRLVEDVGAALATHDDVLDPHAMAPGKVDPGLDAERVAGFQ